MPAENFDYATHAQNKLARNNALGQDLKFVHSNPQIPLTGLLFLLPYLTNLMLNTLMSIISVATLLYLFCLLTWLQHG